ncbi:MAG TPA: DHH family phosphoesterase [Bacteroidales bacterium]|nr:DHH family phosphoesterase [Bacteroidales bacterium]HPM92474.1 DHH family phosphoesterase [Bacteroidales bacterium]
MKHPDIEIIKSIIKDSRSVVVTSHHNPDGDAIGSVIAMVKLLEKRVPQVTGIVPNDFPDFLKWMPGADRIVIYNQLEPKAKELIYNADLIFCLDYNALHRTDAMAPALKSARAVKVLIDHHLDPLSEDFDYIISRIDISSTSELLFNFIEQCGWSDLIGQEVATGLFVGIMTDTGSFSYSCNYPETFQISALLIKTGIDPEQIHRNVYDTYSESRLRLLGYCLGEKMTILPQYKTAYIALTKAELDRFQYKTGDTEGVVNFALSIDEIRFAVLLTERTDRIRLSFRSKGNLSMNVFARKYFNGGGHRNAAGGDSFESMENTISHLKNALEQYKEEIDRSGC